MADQGRRDLDGKAEGAASRTALLRDVSDIRDRASALGLDLVRWFLDMAVLELRDHTRPAEGSASDRPPDADQ